MEQRVSLITLGVADLVRARAFYERLGWKRSVRKAEGVVFFQAGCLALALYPRAELAADANVPAKGSGFSGIALATNVRSREEVGVVLAEAVDAGALLLKPAGDVFWGGTVGYFADPDGHVWEVAWNPKFALGPDGAITLPD